MISDDLVNSYHLLLCALDLVLTNALLCNARKELLNPNFKGINIKIWDYGFLVAPVHTVNQILSLNFFRK